ncbi:unnamed protein product [Cuscuta campestris]|uniref:Nmd3 N-terminal domain-containing protein n=1 Tax=Cuscuta campestris TaxID=132261 RepID=A0A484KNN0_9ASTE|nr:unnamed protein product [Cuscuta campestris]
MPEKKWRAREPTKSIHIHAEGQWTEGLGETSKNSNLETLVANERTLRQKGTYNISDPQILSPLTLRHLHENIFQSPILVEVEDPSLYNLAIVPYDGAFQTLQEDDIPEVGHFNNPKDLEEKLLALDDFPPLPKKGTTEVPKSPKIASTGKEDIASEVVQYFTRVFSTINEGDMGDILRHITSTISEAANKAIGAIPEEEEIKKTVWSLNANSTAGTHGFNGFFFRDALLTLAGGNFSGGLSSGIVMGEDSGRSNDSQTNGDVPCCKCGVPIQPNDFNMCARCLRSEVDITEGLQKHVTLTYCPDCESYLQPPGFWIKAQPESQDLLAFYVERLKDFNEARLVDAEFIWTEPHSKRIRVKLKLQKEVLQGQSLNSRILLSLLSMTSYVNLAQDQGDERKDSIKRRMLALLEAVFKEGDGFCLDLRGVASACSIWFNNMRYREFPSLSFNIGLKEFGVGISLFQPSNVCLLLPVLDFQRIGMLFQAFQALVLKQLRESYYHKDTIMRYRSDPSHVIPADTVNLDENLTYKEEPVEILAREIRQLRNKTIPLVKVGQRIMEPDPDDWQRFSVTSIARSFLVDGPKKKTVYVTSPARWTAVIRVRGIGEGESTTRPPLFDGTNYTYWKERMRIFIQSNNFLLWRIIKNGEEVPTKKVGETTVHKTEDEYDERDIKKIENNAKAINIIYCAVNPDDYRKISCCSTAKEMWDKLEVTYEGTDQVREAKIDFLTHEYELFRMKENEKIDDMFERFSKIINDLHALKKTYTDKELVRKISRSLTLEWRSKADAIQESIGITNVTIDGLRGNLKTYESTILYPSLGEQKKNGIALKASTSQERDVEDSSDKDEFGVVLKKFHKFMRKEFERKGKKQGEPPKCYGCGEVGHIKPKFLNAKNEKKPFKKHRAYISWGGDSSDESSEGEENESTNLCLMTHEEPPEEVCTTSKDSYTFDDVQEAFNELYDEYVNASKINKDLKKQLTSMEKEVDKLSKDNEKLKEENIFFGKRSADKPESPKCCSCTSLKQQVAKLEGTLKKFAVSHKNLNDVLDNLQLTKHGLGATSDDRPLPYALLVMAILDEYNIKTDIGPKIKGTKNWEIDESSFHSGTDETLFRQPHPRHHPRDASSNTPSLAEEMAALTATLSRIDTNVSQTAQNVNILSRELHGYIDFVNYPFAQMVPYAPPPNFRGEPSGTNNVGGEEEVNDEEEEEEEAEEEEDDDDVDDDDEEEEEDIDEEQLLDDLSPDF